METVMKTQNLGETVKVLGGDDFLKKLRQLGSNRPLPEQGILVVRAFFFLIGLWIRLKTRAML
jgi:hypothetical protein